MPFDWAESQTHVGVAINPGTGPVHGTSPENAKGNIVAFVQDVLDGRLEHIEIEDTGEHEDGRYTFVLRHGDRESEIDMPGLPLEEVRYLGREHGQDIWDFPRLYENGSSWVWCYAVGQARSTLFDPIDDEEEG